MFLYPKSESVKGKWLRLHVLQTLHGLGGFVNNDQRSVIIGPTGLESARRTWRNRIKGLARVVGSLATRIPACMLLLAVCNCEHFWHHVWPRCFAIASSGVPVGCMNTNVRLLSAFVSLCMIVKASSLYSGLISWVVLQKALVSEISPRRNIFFFSEVLDDAKKMWCNSTF